MEAPQEVLKAHDGSQITIRCNHCGVFTAITVQETSRDVFLEPYGQKQRQVLSYILRGGMCASCRKANLWLVQHTRPVPGADVPVQGYLVFPRHAYRPEAPAAVPEPLAADYKEALEVLDISPKASAALSRRCLQHLLREQGFKQKDLADQIQAILDSRQLPSDLANAVDSVRAVGNFAAHPIKSKSTGEIVDVESGEAEWNLEVLAELFDFFYVRPAALKEKRERLNQKLDQAGKPPLKGTAAEPNK